MNESYKPRLNVEIRNDQLDELQHLLDHGLRKIVFEAIIDEVIRLLKVNKPIFIAACLSRLPVLDHLMKKDQ